MTGHDTRSRHSIAGLVALLLGVTFVFAVLPAPPADAAVPVQVNLSLTGCNRPANLTLPRPDGKFIYRCGGTVLALYPRPGGTRAEHTALSFRVDDIAREIHELQARGVVFAEYDLPGLKTVDHVCVLGSEKAAWFLDPEGNILCLHEDLKGG